MPLDIDAVQTQLTADRLDGWLLYDFHGLNPIAQKLAGVTGRHTTRRWFYFVPAAGAPRKLVHAIEPDVLDGLPGRRSTYAGRTELVQQLTSTLADARVVAMEYSPLNAVPYISRVDAGTVELVTSLGVRVVSSGDLVGRFEAAWDAAAVETHRRASDVLYDVKDRTFELVGARLAAGDRVTEFAIQQTMVSWMRSQGLAMDEPPIVAAGESSANPHYAPSADESRAIEPGTVVLLDLWGKLDQPGAVYADITWVGYSGEPPEDLRRMFDTAMAGRDAALHLVQSRVREEQAVSGWEVDRAARDVIAAAGFEREFVHRTGHSLGEDVHGNGVHMDDFETHDERRLLPGTGFTIEPGIYGSRFGVRTEINVVVGSHAAAVTGPIQRELVRVRTRV